MITTIQQYFSHLSTGIEEGWNQFWFIPTGSKRLAWMRLFLGLFGLYTIATYGLDLHRFLGPDGMLPSTSIRMLYGDSWSYLEYVPSSRLLTVHWLGVILVGLFTLGVGIRWTSVGATLVLISYFNRTPVLIGQAEALLSMLLVYLCIGRSGELLSVHALWSRRAKGPASSGLLSVTNTVAIRLIQIHLAVICLMMGIAQLTVEAWWTGEAIWLLGNRLEGPLIDFGWLANHPRWMGLWSHLVTAYLMLFPVLIWNRLARPLLLVLSLLVWISMAMVSGQLMLCMTMLVAMFAFCPERSEA